MEENLFGGFLKPFLDKIIPLTLVCLVSSFASAQGSSFSELRSAIYAQPQGANLPAYPGLATWDVVKNLFGSEERPTHGLGVQSRRILVDTRDVRDTREQKWLHPRGACAEARWIITESSSATGLFAAGTTVPAIVRFSTGDASSSYPTEGRIFGMAVKLFPTMDPNHRVQTANIITLDQFGFERSKRPFLLASEASGGEPIYFTNVAPARSALGKFLSTFFDRFDQPNFARPLYATAASNLGGGYLSSYVAPYEIRFVADERVMPRPWKTYSDFRLELQDRPVKPRFLWIVLQSFDGRNQIAKPIGRLELGDFVVSEFCDLSLRFHHSPIEDQFAKYMNYDVVKDLMR